MVVSKHHSALSFPSVTHDIINYHGFFIIEVSMELELAVYDFLKSLPETSFFYICKNQCCTYSGIINGQAVSILVLEKGRMTKKQITFSSKVYRSGGEFYFINSIADMTEIAKVRGWL